MSAANILGSGLYAGKVASDQILKAFGTVSLAVGPGPVVSAAQSVAFMKATDVVLVSYQCGGTVAGPIVVAVANSGLANAAFTIASTGAVAVAPAIMAYAVYEGPSVS
jgi:hypothetical protein